MNLNKKTIFISIICIIAFVSLVANGVLVFMLLRNNQLYSQLQINRKVLDFRNVFTEKILLENKEIDFDTRLSLETAVRELNDAEIFDQWQIFTNSETKEDATTSAKKLLNILIQKTSQ